VLGAIEEILVRLTVIDSLGAWPPQTWGIMDKTLTRIKWGGWQFPLGHRPSVSVQQAKGFAVAGFQTLGGIYVGAGRRGGVLHHNVYRRAGRQGLQILRQLWRLAKGQVVGQDHSA